MNSLIILDNSYSVPANVAGIFGLDNFADLIIRKKSLRQRLKALSVELGWDSLIVIDGGPIRANVAHRISRLSSTGSCAIYIPGYIHLAASDVDVRDMLEKLAYAAQSVSVTDSAHHQATAWLGMHGRTLLVLKPGELSSLLEAPGADTRISELQQLSTQLPRVPSDVPFLDLRDTEEFLQAVTSTFDVRHFNRVAATDRYTIAKQSTNPHKLRQEFQFFASIPAKMKRFFIEPFDFRDDGHSASYRMERLLVPDFALQWLHNSVRTADFEQFIRHVFYFLGERESQPCTPSAGRQAADTLYIDKVVERVASLQAMDGYRAVSMHADHAFGGVERLLERYRALYQRLSPLRSYEQHAIIHGDLCFSNILYNGALGTLKLIDPRGASTLADLYSDPFYDLAKLSHSIEGQYDYINAGQFSIELAPSGTPALRLNAPARPAEIHIFRAHCKAMHAPPRLVRLYEASLFISMTPLHIDAPLKVLAFLLNANDILDIVEDDMAWRD
ncbi:MAG: hypothetical protein EOP38_06375 [Rubrivivax sp.]|nr:MAG: hypothetical protein EOP38_06375 [Rubrivivax sp.]